MSTTILYIVTSSRCVGRNTSRNRNRQIAGEKRKSFDQFRSSCQESCVYFSKPPCSTVQYTTLEPAALNAIHLVGYKIAEEYIVRGQIILYHWGCGQRQSSTMIRRCCKCNCRRPVDWRWRCTNGWRPRTATGPFSRCCFVAIKNLQNVIIAKE
jgi:hypothetical protein